jgi:hypothetical protein
MRPIQQYVDHGGVTVTNGLSSPVYLHLRRLRPVEIVLICRHIHDLPIDGFPVFGRLVVELEKQLIDLLRTDLPFARRVYKTFAISPFPADRLTIVLLVRWLTLADHDAGFSLWHQLVRDENPTVRQEAYEPIHQHLTNTARPPAEGLKHEGLTLTDGQALRDAFTSAHQTGHFHIIRHTIITDTLREATLNIEK